MKTVSTILLSVVAIFLVHFQTTAQTINLPTFSFFDLEGQVFTNKKLNPELPTMVMLFDPYCDHCDTQASSIAEAQEKFMDIQLVFVTIEPEVDPIKAYRDRHFGESELEHVYVLQDKDFMFEGYFGYSDDAINIYLYKPGEKKPKYFGKEQEAENLLKFL